MAKKLKILLPILILSSQTFSQTGINKICFHPDIARKIAIELAQKDSLYSELKYTQNILKETQIKSGFQDSVIISFEKKEIEHKSEVKILEEKEKIHIKKVSDLEKENTELTRKNKNLKTALQWVGGGFITTLSIIVASLTIK
jgi:poly-D-alanine transfer protein DltD